MAGKARAARKSRKAGGIVGIIPARYGSKRLPGKMLVELAGKPLVMHTYGRACEAKLLDRVIVATDDARILEAVTAAGGEAVMTAGTHRCGSDRVAEVASKLECDLVVNVQGDEVLIEPGVIDAAARLLLDDPDADVGTMACPIRTKEEYLDRSVVKVVVALGRQALYFSRAPIPHSKTGRFSSKLDVFRHIGIYSFRRSFLIEYALLPTGRLEQAEDLEQLRALEHGARILVGMTDDHTRLKIDTQEDLERARALLCRSTSS
jgi:3-deoxy-manno-octulosonate cytidylyltransferase (CMP-KDO synthetase)